VSRKVLAILVLALVVGALVRHQGAFFGEADGAPREVTERGPLNPDEAATIQLFENASPSVAYITSIALRQNFFTQNIYEIPQGTGSGFVWDTDGHIITNYHVIQDADRAHVTLADRSTWPASLVGAAPEKDLAVLKIEAPVDRLHPIPIGRSEDLKVGQTVLAIGNPFGLDQSLTTGVISALGREITSVTRVPIRDVIQTDAAINPGNSGGPLLDSAGRLIGVNAAIYSPSGASAGIGFAIPVDAVNWVVPELIAYGEVRRPTLGVNLATPQQTARLNLPGVLVLSVVKGSGAAKAGILPTRRDDQGAIVLGDIITAIDDQPIRQSSDVLLALERRKAGEKVPVTVVRDTKKVTLTVELDPPR
jgi:protease Do-like 1, chloroplastic